MKNNLTTLFVKVIILSPYGKNNFIHPQINLSDHPLVNLHIAFG